MLIGHREGTPQHKGPNGDDTSAILRQKTDVNGRLKTVPLLGFPR
jgi:hypothetical protein